MTPHFQLCVKATLKLHLPGHWVDSATISCAVKSSILRVFHKSIRSGLWLVSVASRQMTPADTQLTRGPSGEGGEGFGLQDDVLDPGKWRTDSDGLARYQQLAAGVGTGFGRAVCVDDLSACPLPGLHEIGREGLACRYNVPADRIGQIFFRLV